MWKATVFWGAKLTDMCIWEDITLETSIYGIIVLQMGFRPN